MFDDETIISGFESRSVADSGPIDFSTATKLDRSGSTCDVFVTRYQRRRVFIKRLREEFRNNSVYRAALDKEYEIGAALSHKSLPSYREFHDDYIVMDYIDGVTLAEILSEKNRELLTWLKRPANLNRMVSELVEAVDYLHRHNVVHCDIKADNIILTDETRNLMLIDFDKAFTSWHDDTRGSASLYGVDLGHGRKTDIDFHGIGKILDRLGKAGLSTKRLNRLRAKCFEKGITAEDLRAILEKRNERKITLILVTLAFLMMVFVATWNLSNDRMRSEDEPFIESAPTLDDRDKENEDSLTTAPIQYEKAEVQKANELTVPVEPDFEEIVEREISPLYIELDILQTQVGDTTMTGDEIMDSLMSYIRLEEEKINEACRKVNSSWHFETKWKGNEKAMMTRVYTRFRQHSDSIQREVSDLWRKRVEVTQ